MLFLSIVIPAYNSQRTIIPLLISIADSKRVKFDEVEVIVVDDKSKDKSIETVERFILRRSNNKFTNLKLIRLKRNVGPAEARNIGVKYAKGKVILFLDADVLVYRDTLYEVFRSFRNDPDLHALTGVWDKSQKSNNFFPKFKALRDWSYWINERDPKNYYYLFSTRVAAIDRDLFLRLGGFDTTYKAALVEDIELTYRIARRYAVVFNPKVIVRHEFEDFVPIAKKYFWRSYYWSKIYRERKKFDPVATTSKEAITTLSAGGLIVSLLCAGVLSVWGMRGIREIWEVEFWFLVLGSSFLVIHIWGVRKFLWFCAKEEGIWFAVKAFFTGIILYLIILSGAVVSFLSTLWQRAKKSH